MNRRSSVAFLHLAVMLFGFAGVIGRFVSLPAVLVTFYRVLFASASLLALALLRRQPLSLPQRRDIVPLCAAGGIMAIHWTSFIASVQISGVAIGTITFSTFPLFVTFLEPLIYKEKLRAFDVAAAFFMLGGVVLTVPEFSLYNDATIGIIWGMVSSASYAALSLLNRRFAGRYSGSTICLYEQGFAALLLLPAPFLIQAPMTPSDAAALVFMGAVCTALAHALYTGSLRYVKVQTASVVSGMETVYGIVLAFFFLHEVPAPREIAGGLVIMLTAAAVSLLRGRK